MKTVERVRWRAIEGELTLPLNREGQTVFAHGPHALPSAPDSDRIEALRALIGVILLAPTHVFEITLDDPREVVAAFDQISRDSLIDRV